jgi:hypothetical protein
MTSIASIIKNKYVTPMAFDKGNGYQKINTNIKAKLAMNKEIAKCPIKNLTRFLCIFTFQFLYLFTHLSCIIYPTKKF